MLNKIIQIKRYITYFISAKHYNGHGIHSPFLYEIAKNVIFKKDPKKNYSNLNEYLNKLKKDQTEIQILESGAGSRHLKNRKRKISSIAKTGTTRKKYGTLISRLVYYLKPRNIIELGTSLGVGTLYLSCGSSSESKIYTIEAEESLFKIASEKFKSLNIQNIYPVQGEFDTILPNLLIESENVDFVYIDGNHRKEPTLRYFEWILSKKNNNTVIVFDDIHWSLEMEEAWKNIKLHPQVRLSVDLFQLGIVFFRKELSKEDYTIIF